MLPESVIALSGLFLFLASYKDLETGEIPEVLTRGFTASILCVSAIAALYSLDPWLFLEPLVLGVGFFSLGYLMFYLGEWGGGDVKLLFGIGSSLGLLSATGFFTGNMGFFPYYANYFINFALAAGPYVIAYSLVLGLLRPRVFSGFVSNLNNRFYILLIALSFAPALLAFYSGLENMALAYLLIPLLSIVTLYLKAVEEIALQKEVDVSELNEEDMLSEDLFFEGQKLASRRDADGLSCDQVERIQALAREGKIPSRISIRWGIRFAPVFAFAYAMTLVLGDALEIIVYAIMT